MKTNRYDINTLTETFSSESARKKVATEVVVKRQDRGTFSADEIEIVAVVGKNSDREIFTIANWAKLYDSADGPRVEFAEKLRHLWAISRRLNELESAPLEFELEVTHLWTSIRALDGYLHISTRHAEAIATLQSLTVIPNCILDGPKLSALTQCLDKLRFGFNVTDALLDECWDLLEAGGFDLDLAMDGAPIFSADESTSFS